MRSPIPIALFWHFASMVLAGSNAPAIITAPRRLAPRVTTLTSPTGPQQSGTIATCNKWYNVVSGDSCSLVESTFGITHAQFIAWNPAVSEDCSTNFWIGDTYCVGVSTTGATSTTATATSSISASSAQTSPGSPTMSGIPCNCNLYYDVKSGDSCGTVESKFGITHSEFLLWNPAVSQDCATNFWVDESYCVGVGSGDLCVTTSLTSTTSSSTSKSSIPPNTEPYSIIGSEISAVQVARPTATSWPPAPTLAGTATNCIRYYYVNPGDTCDSIVSRYSHLITIDEFMQWNPSLSATNCSSLYVNYYYCVDTPIDAAAQPNATSQWLPEWTPTSLPVQNTSDQVPEPTAPGAVSSCQSWYQAEEGDSCASIINELGYLKESELQSWNSGVDCSSLVVGDYYCVANYDQSSLPMPSTVTTAPSSTQTGIIADCNAWYLAANSDTCDLIPQYFGTFSEEDFLSWNPALGGEACTGLLGGEYYCVGVPGTPTTRTSSPSSTPVETNGVGPQPEQPGIPSDCIAYWLVSSTDNCTTIAQANGITEDQIEQWNPALGDGCPSLLLNYYICVGVSEGSAASSTITSSTPSSSVTGANTIASSTSATSSALSTPTPTQSGMTANCQRFYMVESGDGCWAISNDVGISLDDFYAWNPAVNTDCSLLLTGFYVCIGTAGPATTISTGPPIAAATQ